MMKKKSKMLMIGAVVAAVSLFTDLKYEMMEPFVYMLHEMIINKRGQY